MKLFLSGPMSGHPYLNRRSFDDIATLLEEYGHDVVNPMDYLYSKDLDHKTEWTPDLYKEVLYDMIDTIMYHDIEGVVVIPGWEKSSGSCAEVAVAKAIGLPVCDKNYWMVKK